MSALNRREFSSIGSLRKCLGFFTVFSLALLAACSDDKVEEAAPALVSIQVTPPAPSIANGTTQQFTATGTYSNGTTQNLTATVAWSSANTAVTTISANGLASGVTAGGPVTVTATSGGISSTANLTITAATLVSIQVTPPAPSIAAGTTQQFTATGTYTDFSTQNLTATATWGSSNAAVATVAGGLATGVTVGGPVTITATSGLISGTANLTVTAATLVSIQVTPPAPSIARGTTQQFTAMGTYTDFSTQNLTATAAWGTSNAAIATVVGGLASGVTVGGPVTITAIVGAISGTASLTVTAATLVSIQVTPPAPTIAAGTTQQFTAIGTYSDFSTQNLTATASWGSSNTAIATVLAGLATGVTVSGPVTITATSGAISGTASLTVTAAALVSIQVTPPAPTIAAGTTQQFTAMGTYTDFSTQNLTATASWGSSNTAIATVLAGLATGVTVGGPVTITATSGAISGTASLTVTAATLVSIQVTPPAPSIAAGTTQQFTALGTYSDFTSQDLTATASWISSNAAVATITSPGALATGVIVGGVTITATSGAISGTASLTVTPALLVSIQVTTTPPATLSIPAGTNLQYTATGAYTDLTTQDLTGSVSWGSSNLAIATITSPGGLATGVIAGGPVTITATSGAISGTANLTVTAALLVSVQVTPPSASIAKGTTQQFTATATYTDATTQNVTATASWASSNTAIATVVGGLATGVTVGGPVSITATFGGMSSPGSLTVTPAVLASIQVTPATRSIAATTTQQFTATGTFTDATTQDLTGSVSWGSSNLAVATITSPGGLATGVIAGGPVTITATSAAISGTASLTVTAATLVSIQVTPPAPSIAAGTTQQFTATGTFSDATTQDITALASWGSSDTAIATVLGGLATGVTAGGSVSITATFGGVFSPAANLTVTAATLVSIQVTPASKSIAAGTTQQFIATGIYTDFTTQDLTGSASWSSSNAAIATISSPGGLAFGVTAGGPVTITATSGATSGTASLTVTPALLVSIQVTPSPVSIPKGTTQQFTATGHYTDGNTQDLTAGSSWGSSNTAVATVLGGLATGVGVGGVTITATFGGISSPPAGLRVRNAVLVSIAVTPPSASIAAGTTQQFIATGTYTDATTQNLTATVAWNSDDTAIATIDAVGLATGVIVGGVTITATSDAISGTASLTVTAATLVSIAVTPASASIAVGTTQQFTATGFYTDASSQDLTISASWVSGDTAIATVLSGLATGVSAGGPVSITATFGGVSSPAANLTVTAVANQGSPGTPFTILAMPYNQGQVTGPGGTSYYAFTTITPVNTITVTSITGGGVDATVYTAADFLSPDLNWSCSAIAGNANDTCTSAGVLAGVTLYIGVVKSGSGSSTFTLNVQ